MPNFRFTVRWTMAIVALVGSLCGVEIALAKRGYVLVDFDYPKVVSNKALKRPLKIVKIEGENIFLENNLRIKLFEDYGKLAPCHRFLELQPESDASVAVYISEKLWFCGNRKRQRFPIVRIPIVPRMIDENYRVLVGRARLEEPVRPSQGQSAEAITSGTDTPR